MANLSIVANIFYTALFFVVVIIFFPKSPKHNVKGGPRGIELKSYIHMYVFFYVRVYVRENVHSFSYVT